MTTATAAGTVAVLATPSAVPRRVESQLHATIDSGHIPGSGNPGRDGRLAHAVLVDFENTSTRACTLYGYPGAAIVGFDGSQVQQATRTTRGNYGGRDTTVTLRPRHYAAAYLEGEKSTAPTG